jgi:hypothetical protein
MIGLPSMSVRECAAGMIREIVGGKTRETLQPADLVRIGREELKVSGLG